jgi:hypothetical protein
MRYEAHTLFYTPEDGETIELRGFLAAAILAALLVDTDEGDARGIALDTPEQREELFARYEREVRRDDWGYLSAEVNQLRDNYVQLAVDSITLHDICPNNRLLELAMDVTVAYMQHLVLKIYRDHIWEVMPWEMPFPQWLIDAARVETRRQRYLQTDWTDPALVHELACYMEKDEPEEPIFVFEDEEAADIMARYWDWLWNFAQKDAAVFPDSKVVMADYKQLILKEETDWDFIKPEMKDFKPEQINLFRKWMNQWTDFVKDKIEPPVSTRKKKEEEQLFFPDEVLKCPTEDDPEKYAATREYVKERKKYDENFRKFAKNESHARLCRQLTLLFGWYVDPSSLRKSLLRKPKRKTKQYT